MVDIPGRLGFVVAFLVAISLLACSGQSSVAQTPPDLAEALRRYDELGVSGTAAIGRPGQIETSGEMGLADRGSGRRNTLDTVFDIGSLAKPVTAVLIMRLQEQGLIETDARIGRYLDRIPRSKRAITIHHLLSHSSGLPPYVVQDFATVTRRVPVRKVLEAPLLFAPGKGISYSNAGYSLLAAIAQKVSGTPFKRLVRDEVISPAGSTATGWLGDEDLASHPLAHGYIDGKDHGTVADSPPAGWALYGNGGMTSTPRDMFAFVSAVADGTLLKPESVGAMTTGYGAGDQKEGYGCVVIEGPSGTRCAAAGGNDFAGMETAFAWDVDEGTILVASTNDRSYLAGPLVGDMQRIREGDQQVFPPDPVEVDPAVLSGYESRWNLDRGYLDVTASETGLVIEPHGSLAFDLLFPPPEGLAADLQERERAVEAFLERLPTLNAKTFPLIREWFEDKERELGPYRGHAIWGTVFQGPDPWTFCRLRFRDGAVIIRLDIEPPGRLVGVDLAPALPTTTVVPETSVLYRRFTVPASHVELGFDAEGSAASTLRIVSEGSEGIATR